MKKWCPKCEKDLDVERFSIDRQKPDGRCVMCKPCKSKYNKAMGGLEYSRAWHLRDKYGLTVERLEEMKKEQDGKCASCRRLALLVVDHSHVTGNVRALLCSPCNRALGFLRDDPEVVRSLLAYISSHAAQPL